MAGFAVKNSLGLCMGVGESETRSIVTVFCLFSFCLGTRINCVVACCDGASLGWSVETFFY